MINFPTSIGQITVTTESLESSDFVLIGFEGTDAKVCIYVDKPNPFTSIDGYTLVFDPQPDAPRYPEDLVEQVRIVIKKDKGDK